LARLFAHAALPERFADVSFATYPSENDNGWRAVQAWAAGGDRRSLVLWGPHGRGKTGLAVSALRDRIERAATDALFITTPKLLDRIRATYSGGEGAGAEADVLHAVETVPLLVLDDLGAERVTEWQREKLFTILNARHDALLPTIYTTNLNPKTLGTHLGERTVDRLKQDCVWIELGGPNLREREG
jgi:DNA replication protein DnaC